MIRSDDAGGTSDLARSEMETRDFQSKPAAPSALTLPTGTLLAQRYRILGLLGAGGMGAVYSAKNERIGRRVALKLVTTDKGPGHSELMRRFEIEARAASDLGHDHIVDVLDVGELSDGTPFLVMEHLDGRDLRAALEADGPFTVGRMARVLVPICEALDAVHGKGVVHRDLKPANIFLAKGAAEHPKILDFGVSKLPANQGETQTGVALGTPGYMSPEQARGLRDVDVRSDIFSLGVIAYELLAGERPFSAPSVPVLLLRIVHQEPVPIGERRGDLPDAIVRLVGDALAKDASARLPSVLHFANALRPFLNHDRAPELRQAPALISSMANEFAGSAPVDAAPVDAAPVNAAPVNAAPVNAAPVDAAPVDAAPVDAAPVNAAPAGVSAESTSGSGLAPAARRVGLFGVVAVLMVVASAAIFSREGSTSASPASSPVVSPQLEVRLRIQTSPPDARITLDGHTLDAPVDITRPRDLEFLTLRVEAPGFVSDERALVLDRDQTLTVTLDEDLVEEVTVAPREQTPRPPPATPRVRAAAAASAESMVAEPVVAAESMAAESTAEIPIEEPAPREEGDLRREF
ncbi:MAG: protein kinase [Polyangiales bacterium]